MISVRRLVSHLPKNVQHEIKRVVFARQIRRNKFIPHEPEIELIKSVVTEGDWAIDVGANVGHYTLELSKRVGPTGRVLAFEPVPQTFELLATNLTAAKARNVSLFNAAASNGSSVLSMDIPEFVDTHLDNYYQARLSNAGQLNVLCLPIDAIPFPHAIRLVKIDAEGHDLQVLEGMQNMIAKDQPVLIVESDETGDIPQWLQRRGYSIKKTGASPNIVAYPANYSTQSKL